MTFTTANRSLATYLFKLGYDTFTIEKIDGNRCFTFTIPKELENTFKKDRANWKHV